MLSLSKLRYHLDLLAHTLKTQGLTHIVVSPGSRNAPIIAGFLREGDFEILSAPDERAAAFMAMGASQATGRAAAVICTSGTAVLNLYPGICEAWYQQIPLIAITADRPAEMIDRWDGQTIHQPGIFEKHIRGQYNMNVSLHQEGAEAAVIQTACEAWDEAHRFNGAPVHINIPLEEPIYANIDGPLTTEWPPIPYYKGHAAPLAVTIPEVITNTSNLLILAGQMSPRPELNAALNTLADHVPVLADILSNITGKNIIQGTESMVRSAMPQVPEVLVTCGKSIVSKVLKTWLRANKPRHHFHVTEGGFVGDPFFTNPTVITCNPVHFFAALQHLQSQEQQAFRQSWMDAFHTQIPDAEKNMTGRLMTAAKGAVTWHLANSLTIRLANRLTEPKGKIFGNRGTSGIDGTISTAAGYAWGQPDELVVCITGDVGFLYDKNAYWCHPRPKNLRTLVINNRGGKIFSALDGPGRYPELLPLIETPHDLSAAHIAAHYGLTYRAMNEADLYSGNADIVLEADITEIFTDNP